MHYLLHFLVVRTLRLVTMQWKQTSGVDANVCIGHYAGFDVQGNNNVLIGPAYNETSADVTFRPPNI